MHMKRIPIMVEKDLNIYIFIEVCLYTEHTLLITSSYPSYFYHIYFFVFLRQRELLWLLVNQVYHGSFIFSRDILSWLFHLK